MKPRNIILVFIFFFSISFIPAEGSETSGLMAENCRIRLIPSKEPKAAGYLTIHNHGSDNRVLTSLSMKEAGKVEMHQTVVEEGMAKMLAVKELLIPSHGTVKMKSGGYHLMFKKMSPDLKFGDTVTLNLHFKNGEKIPVQAKIVSVQQDLEMRHQHNH